MIVKSADDPVTVVLTVSQVSDLIDVLNAGEYVLAYYGKTDEYYATCASKAGDLLRVLEGVWRKEVDR